MDKTITGSALLVLILTVLPEAARQAQAAIPLLLGFLLLLAIVRLAAPPQKKR